MGGVWNELVLQRIHLVTDRFPLPTQEKDPAAPTHNLTYDTGALSKQLVETCQLTT